MIPKIWLTVAEGAEYSGVCRDTIYSACERCELRHTRVGGRRAIRLRAEWIDAWLERFSRTKEDLTAVEALSRASFR
ncbi:MAG: helix-turn-helix domain-containing protein [Acidobacteriota bacterium]